MNDRMTKPSIYHSPSKNLLFVPVSFVRANNESCPTEYLPNKSVVFVQTKRWNDKSCPTKMYWVPDKIIPSMSCPTKYFFCPTWFLFCPTKQIIRSNKNKWLDRTNATPQQMICPTNDKTNNLPTEYFVLPTKNKWFAQQIIFCPTNTILIGSFPTGPWDWRNLKHMYRLFVS